MEIGTTIILSHGPSINEERVFGETKKRLDEDIRLYKVKASGGI